MAFLFSGLPLALTNATWPAAFFSCFITGFRFGKGVALGSGFAGSAAAGINGGGSSHATLVRSVGEGSPPRLFGLGLAGGAQDGETSEPGGLTLVLVVSGLPPGKSILTVAPSPPFHSTFRGLFRRVE